MAFPHRAAERVLDQLGITSPEDLQLLDSIAWERGATVLVRPMYGAEARLAALGNRAIITISSLVKDPRRKRFSVAHELGHFELHREHSVVLCSSQDIDDWKQRGDNISPEQEANEFAAALLLPERFFASLCRDSDPSLDLVAELASTFNVSLTATALRYLRFCDEICAVVFSQDGHIKWFQSSRGFAETGAYIDVRSRLAPSSLAASIFQGHIAQTAPKRIRASVWLESGQHSPDSYVMEQSWGMPNYNAVLTLLWLDEDIEDAVDFWLM